MNSTVSAAKSVEPDRNLARPGQDLQVKFAFLGFRSDKTKQKYELWKFVHKGLDIKTNTTI